MSEHPIQNLMDTVMKNLKDMVDVNTVVGEAVKTPDGSVIVPVSKVGFGFGVGGGNIPNVSMSKPNINTNVNATPDQNFGGGSGGGVTIKPMGFLVVNADTIKFLPVDTQNSTLDKIIDLVPEVLNKINKMVSKGCCVKENGEEEKDEVVEAVIIEENKE